MEYPLQLLIHYPTHLLYADISYFIENRVECIGAFSLQNTTRQIQI